MLDLVTHVNTRLKLFEKISLLLAVMVVVASLNLAVIYTYHQQADQVGNSVNVAGQQRMLSQRMVRLANDIAYGQEPTVARDRLQVAIDRYDRNLEVLTDGGTVTDTQLNPGADSDTGQPTVVLRGERLAPAPSSTAEELARERAVWADFEPHVRTLLEADPDSASFQESHQYVRSNADELLAVSDTVTAEFAREIRDRRTALEQVLVVLFVLDLIVAAGGALLARRFLGLPMVAIARRGRRLAAGDTEPGDDEPIPIDRSLPDHKQRAELADLSRAFEAVRQYHLTVSAQAQALARREFDAPVLEETVPGELGRSLETMRADLEAHIDELTRTTEKLDAVIQASPAAIVITDTRGRVKRWNPAAEQIFGWDAAAVAGSPNPAVPEDTFERYRKRLSEVIVEESVTGIEDVWQTKTGEAIDVSLSLATVSGADQEITGVMAVIEDISDRKERERTLRTQRDELATLARITDLVLAITQALVGAPSRERIEDAACASLGESDLYRTAWIGESQAGSQEIRVRSASWPAGPMERVRPDPEGPVGEAIRAASSTGVVQVTTASADADIVTPGAALEGEDGAVAVAAVPLAYRGTVYGVLVVSTEREFAFRDRERAGLETLGQTIGLAINAITTRKLLFADTVVDLSFDVSDTGLPLVPTSAALGCGLSLDGFVRTAAGDALDLYLEVVGVDAEAVCEQVREEPAVVDAHVIADEPDHRRVEVTVEESSILGRVAHHEAKLSAIELEDGRGTYVVEAPLSADLEAIVELFQTADPGVELVAKSERERRVNTPAEVATAMRDRLTDRQYEVFKTAYYGGYFEWPRDSTIEDIAANMGLAGSTVHHHLRHAERKLAATLFERGSAPASS